ncbi:MAG: hypothetical protein ACI9WS_001266 [Paraglaciecola psychrophila]|jgi:hypothetical protein
MDWQSIKERFARDSDAESSSVMPKLVLWLLALYLLAILLVGAYWSVLPGPVDVEQYARSASAGNDQRVVVGTTTTAALISTLEVLLEKRGGFLSNDIFPPGVWLDNVPSWEYGVLIQSRDLTRALRESFSRSQSQSQEDISLSKAEPSLNFSSDSWAIPATETEYRKAVKLLEEYLRRLGDQSSTQSQFYARADNLSYWLAIVESRLGSLSQRLSASVGKPRLNTDLSGDSSAQQSTAAPSELEVKTPWNELDNVFYESRGSAWALSQFLRAAQIDFSDVLEKKNAQVSLRQIIRELEGAQQSVYSPVILNGSGYGVLTNHSLVMASYISRANAAIIDLRDLLSQG